MSDSDQPISNTLLLNLVFGNGGFDDQISTSLLSVFVRKLDIAAEMYEAARRAFDVHGLRDPEAGTVVFNIPRAGDLLELSVLSLRRAWRCLEALNARPDARAINKYDRRQISSVLSQLKVVRDSTEHVEERIRDGLAGAGSPHTLAIAADGRSATIAGDVLDIDSYASCIETLQAVARELSQRRSGT